MGWAVATNSRLLSFPITNKQIDFAQEQFGRPAKLKNTLESPSTEHTNIEERKLERQWTLTITKARLGNVGDDSGAVEVRRK